MDEDTINDLKQFITATVSLDSRSLKAGMRTVKKDIRTIKTDVASLKSDALNIKTDVFSIKVFVCIVRADIRKLDIKLSRKIDNLSESVADTFERINVDNYRRLDNHETRIKKLELSV